jgi:hypothetical protein
MGLHDHYYGKDAEPANNNQEGPWVSPAHAQMSAGLVELREKLGVEELEPFRPEPVERFHADKIRRILAEDDDE